MANPLDGDLLGDFEPSLKMEDELGLGQSEPWNVDFPELSSGLASPFDDLSETDLYRGYKLFRDDYTAAKSDASELAAITKGKEDALEEFLDKTLKPFYGTFMGNPPEFDPKYKTAEEYIADMDAHITSKEKAAAEKGWFGGSTGDAEKAAAFLGGQEVSRYALVKQKYARIQEDMLRAQEASDKAAHVRDSMRATNMSLPEHFRKAAKAHKDKADPTIPRLSNKETDSLLDKMRFEEPKYDSFGRLTNQEKLDPRKELTGKGRYAPFGDKKTPKEEKQRKQLLEDIQSQKHLRYKQEVASRLRDEKARKANWLFSDSGYFGNYPLYVNRQERELLDLEKAQKMGFKQYRGLPIGQAFAELGGEDAMETAKMMETLWGAWNVYEKTQLDYISNIGSAKKDAAKKKMEVAKEAWLSALGSASSMGLLQNAIERMDKPFMFADTIDALKRGDLAEDLAKFTPIMMLRDKLPTATIEQIIEAAEAIEDAPKSSAYEKSMAKGPSGNLFESMGRFLTNPGAAWDLAWESFAGFMNSYFNTVVPVVASTTTAGAAAGTVIPGKGTVAGGLFGAKWGLRLNAGVASFMLEAAADMIHEMEKMGLDWHNTKVFEAAWNNPEIRDKLRDHAKRKGVPIAVLDTMAASLGGRMAGLGRQIKSRGLPQAVGDAAGLAVAGVTKPVKTYKKISGKLTEWDSKVQKNTWKERLGNVGYELGGGGALGGGGELLGQLWSRDQGEALDWDAIAAEMIVEGAGPSSFGVAKAMMSPNTPIIGGNWGDATGIAKEFNPSEVTVKNFNVTSLRDGKPRTLNIKSEGWSRGSWSDSDLIFENPNDFADFLAANETLQVPPEEAEAIQQILKLRQVKPGVTPEGFDVGGSLTRGKKNNNRIRVVISPRTPTGRKNQRGHLELSAERGPTLYLNSHRLKKGKNNVGYVVIHEAIHLIRPSVVDDETLRALWRNLNEVDEKFQKNAIAAYTLKRHDAEYDKLGPIDKIKVDGQIRVFERSGQSELLMAEEWFAYEAIRMLGGQAPHAASPEARATIKKFASSLQNELSTEPFKRFAINEGLIDATYDVTETDEDGNEVTKTKEAPRKAIWEALAKVMDPMAFISTDPDNPVKSHTEDGAETEAAEQMEFDLGSDITPDQKFLPGPQGNLPEYWLKKMDILAKGKEAAETRKHIAWFLGYDSWSAVPKEGKEAIVDMFANAPEVTDTVDLDTLPVPDVKETEEVGAPDAFVPALMKSLLASLKGTLPDEVIAAANTYWFKSRTLRPEPTDGVLIGKIAEDFGLNPEELKKHLSDIYSAYSTEASTKWVGAEGVKGGRGASAPKSQPLPAAPEGTAETQREKSDIERLKELNAKKELTNDEKVERVRLVSAIKEAKRKKVKEEGQDSKAKGQWTKEPKTREKKITETREGKARLEKIRREKAPAREPTVPANERDAYTDAQARAENEKALEEKAKRDKKAAASAAKKLQDEAVVSRNIKKSIKRGEPVSHLHTRRVAQKRLEELNAKKELTEAEKKEKKQLIPKTQSTPFRKNEKGEWTRSPKGRNKQAVFEFTERPLTEAEKKKNRAAWKRDRDELKKNVDKAQKSIDKVLRGKFTKRYGGEAKPSIPAPEVFKTHQTLQSQERRALPKNKRQLSSLKALAQTRNYYQNALEVMDSMADSVVDQYTPTPIGVWYDQFGAFHKDSKRITTPEREAASEGVQWVEVDFEFTEKTVDGSKVWVIEESDETREVLTDRDMLLVYDERKKETKAEKKKKEAREKDKTGTGPADYTSMFPEGTKYITTRFMKSIGLDAALSIKARAADVNNSPWFRAMRTVVYNLGQWMKQDTPARFNKYFYESLAAQMPNIIASKTEQQEMSALYERDISSREANGIKALRTLKSSDKWFYFVSAGPKGKDKAVPPTTRLAPEYNRSRTPEAHFENVQMQKEYLEGEEAFFSQVIDKMLQFEEKTSLGQTLLEKAAEDAGLSRPDPKTKLPVPLSHSELLNDLFGVYQLEDLVEAKQAVTGFSAAVHATEPGSTTPVRFEKYPFERGPFVGAKTYEDITEDYHKASKEEKKKIEANPRFRKVTRTTNTSKGMVNVPYQKYVKGKPLPMVVLMEGVVDKSSNTVKTEPYTVDDIIRFSVTQKNVNVKHKLRNLPRVLVDQDGKVLGNGKFPHNIRGHLESALYGQQYQVKGKPYGGLSSTIPLGVIMSAYLSISPPKTGSLPGTGWSRDENVNMAKVITALFEGMIPGMYLHNPSRYGTESKPPVPVPHSELGFANDRVEMRIRNAAAKKLFKKNYKQLTEDEQIAVRKQILSDGKGDSTKAPDLNIDPYSDTRILDLLNKWGRAMYGKPYGSLSKKEKAALVKGLPGDAQGPSAAISIKNEIAELLSSKLTLVTDVLYNIEPYKAAKYLDLTVQEVQSLNVMVAWEIGKIDKTVDPESIISWMDSETGQFEEHMYMWQRKREQEAQDDARESLAKREKKRKKAKRTREQYPQEVQLKMAPRAEELEESGKRPSLEKREAIASFVFSPEDVLAGEKGVKEIDRWTREGVQPADLREFTLVEAAVFMLSGAYKDENLHYDDVIIVGGKRTMGSPGKGYLLAFDPYSAKAERPELIAAVPVSGSVTKAVSAKIEVKSDTLLDEALKHIEKNVISKERLAEIKKALRDMKGLVHTDQQMEGSGFFTLKQEGGAYVEGDPLFKNDAEFNKYVKENNGILPAYYKALFEKQALIAKDKENEHSYTRTVDGELWRKYFKDEKGASYEVFGVGDIAAGNISNWATRSKMMAITREMVEAGYITDEMVQAFNGGVFMYEELTGRTPEMLADAQTSLRTGKTAMLDPSVSVGVEEISEWKELEDPVVTQRREEVKAAREAKLASESKIGTNEAPRSELNEPDPNEDVILQAAMEKGELPRAKGHSVEEVVYLRSLGLNTIEEFVTGYAAKLGKRGPGLVKKSGKDKGKVISKGKLKGADVLTEKDFQTLAKNYWKNLPPETRRKIKENAQKKYEEGKGGMPYYLGSDSTSVVPPWDPSHPGLGSDPTSPYSQFHFLTSDTWASNVDRFIAAMAKGGKRIDDKLLGGWFGRTIPDMKMRLTTQFLPYRELVEKMRKELELPHDHPLIQDLNIYADMMAYHGKGAEALFEATKRYYDFLTEKLGEYGIAPRDFGEFVQATAAPLRNRAGAFRLLTDYNEAINEVKRLKKELSEKPTDAQFKKVILEFENEISKIEDDIKAAEKKDADVSDLKKKLSGKKNSLRKVLKEESNVGRIKSDLKIHEKTAEDFNPKNYTRDGEVVYSGISTKEAKETLTRLLKKESFQKMVKDGELLERYYEMNMDSLFQAWNSGMTSTEHTIRMAILNTRAPNMRSKLMPLVQGGILVDETDGDIKKYEKAVRAKLKELSKSGVPREDERNKETSLVFWSAALTLEESIIRTKKAGGSERLSPETIDVLKLGLVKKESEELKLKVGDVYMFQGGYQYTPFIGFMGESAEYERTERLAQAKGETSTNKGRGWDSPSGAPVYDSKGRVVGVKPPSPRLTMPRAFQAHSEAVIWNLKSEVRGSVVEFHSLLSLLDKALEGGLNKEKIAQIKEEHPLWFEGYKTDELLESHIKYLHKEFSEIFELEPVEEGEYYKVVSSVTENEVGKTINKIPTMGKRKVLRKLEGKKEELSLVHMVQGKPHIIRFKDNDRGRMFARALKNTKYERMNGILKIINPVTRLMARAFTAWNPEFMLANLTRDMQGAFLNLREDEKKAFATKVLDLRRIGGAIKAIWNNEKAMEAMGGKMKKGEGALLLQEFESSKGAKREAFLNDTAVMMRIFAQAGGKTGFFKFSTIGEMLQDFEKKTEPAKFSKNPRQWLPPSWGGGKSNGLSGTNPGKFAKGMKFVETMVNDGNSSIENSVRLIAFTEALRMGFTTKDAVQVARNVTVDFNKKGEWGSNMGALWLFFNAGVQGNIRVMRAIMNRGGKDGLNLILLIMSASIANAIYNRIFAPRDDEEDRSEFDNLGTWERDSNMIFYVPGTDKRVRLPIPWGYSIFWAMGQRMADVMSGPEDKGLIDSTLSFINNVDNQLNPWSNSFPLPVPLPTFIDPILQYAANEKFYGAPIERDDLDFGAPVPAAYRNMPGTHPFYAKISQLANSLMGGDEVTPGSIRNMAHSLGVGRPKLEYPLENDIEPIMSGSMLEHFVEGYFGGPMKAALGVWDVGSAIFDWDAPKSKDVPIARRFFVSETSDWITTKRFYDLRKRTLIADRYVKNLEKNVSADASRQGAQVNAKLIKAKAFVDAADTARKALMRMETKIKSSRLSKSEKNEKLEELRNKKIQATRRALAKARALGILA